MSSESILANLKKIGLKWSQCSSTENQAASKAMVASLVYVLYLKQSEQDLHIVEVPKGANPRLGGGLEIYVRRDYDPYTFALLPYNSAVHSEEASDTSPLELVLAPEEEPVTCPFSLKPKVTPKQFALGAEKAVVLVPFWVLANNVAAGAEPSPGSIPLAYATACFPFPTPGPVAKGVRSAKSVSIKVRMLYATNAVRLAKGNCIYLPHPPPAALPSVE